MLSSSHPNNIKGVSAAIEAVKDHPGVFCRPAIDEPYAHDPNNHIRF